MQNTQHTTHVWYLRAVADFAHVPLAVCVSVWVTHGNIRLVWFVRKHHCKLQRVVVRFVLPFRKCAIVGEILQYTTRVNVGNARHKICVNITRDREGASEARQTPHR